MHTPAVTRQDLEHVMVQAAGYMARACGEDGRFQYLAGGDQASDGKYNITRHCGALYALACYADYAKAWDKTFDSNVVLRAANFLRSNALAPVPDRPGAQAVWSYPGINDTVKAETAKLGASGLGLCALTLYERFQPGTVPADVLTGLEAFLIAMQKPDGDFYHKFLEGAPNDDWKSQYYSGEAILGLLTYYQYSESEPALRAALQGLIHLAEKRAGKSKVARDHWTLIASARLFELSGLDLDRPTRDLLLGQVSQITIALASAFAPKRVNSVRLCALATQLEGMLAASQILNQRDGLLCDAIRSSVGDGIGILSDAQITEGPLLGGIPTRHRQGSDEPRSADGEVRIDNVQHALSAMMAYHQLYDVLEVSSDPSSQQALEESIELCARFIRAQQKPAGNFNYAYDWTDGVHDPGDNSVRQAGALWGIALHYRASRSPQSLKTCHQGIDFFLEHSLLDPKLGRFVVYPGEKQGSIGTIALCVLAMIEVVRAIDSDDPKLAKYKEHLREFTRFLKSARTDRGLWHGRYSHNSGRPHGDPSPYFDGESLLALVRAAKYVDGFGDLRQTVMTSAASGFLHHILLALRRDLDSPVTKGFYQWSTMAFFEIFTSGWDDADIYGDHILYLADWMIDTHDVLSRTRNTAYAFEGLAHAYRVAVLRNDERQLKYREVLCCGMSRLISWQVGHPLANPYIGQFKPQPEDIGGVLGKADEGLLRIDAAQHTLHALMLTMSCLTADSVPGPDLKVTLQH